MTIKAHKNYLRKLDRPLTQATRYFQRRAPLKLSSKTCKISKCPRKSPAASKSHQAKHTAGLEAHELSITELLDGDHEMSILKKIINVIIERSENIGKE